MQKSKQKIYTPIAFRAVGVFFVFLFVVFSMALAGCGSSQEQKAVEDKHVRELRIKTSDKEHVFSVELALDDAEQAKGLMFRRNMADDHGMLFVYDMERVIGMWMKNTFLPLDMLFLESDGRIVKIARHTEPHSTDVISSQKPVLAVLELNAGTSDHLAISVGDRVLHPLLGAQ